MVQEIINNCTIDGNVVRLPEGQLDRKVYEQVAKRLNGIGGKWKGGKVMGFVFPHDPSELLSKIQEGESINLKKDFQFFETPEDLVKQMEHMAHIESGHKVLEPSAGRGAIAKRLQKYTCHNIDAYELNELMWPELHSLGVRVLGADFLESNPDDKYDRIVANPPFTKNQDIKHIYAMYDRLRLGGRLVSIASTHWRLSDNRLEKDFRLWLEEVKAEVHDVERGRFKESGTDIATVIIVIDK